MSNYLRLSSSGSRTIRRGVRWTRPRPAAPAKGGRYSRLGTSGVLAALLFAGAAQSNYVVKRGDTLWKIAKDNATTTAVLAEANELADPSLIIAGQTLLIPAPASVPQVSPALTRSHTVAAGENLTKIAFVYNTSPWEIAEANGLDNANLIFPGQVLDIPGGSPTVEGLLEAHAKEFGVDAALVKGLAWQESGWNQDVVSSAGAIGVMQVLPGTGEFVARDLLESPVDLNDTSHNIRAGVAFLSHLFELAGGDEKLAVAGYYQGLRSIRLNGMRPWTKRYVDNVMALKVRFGG